MDRDCCAVPGCQSRLGKLTLKYFPQDENSIQAAEWVEFLARAGLVPGSYSRPDVAVCELHFDENRHFYPRRQGRSRLKASAVPTTVMKVSKYASILKPSALTKQPFGDRTNRQENSVESGALEGPSSLLTSQKHDAALLDEHRDRRQSDCGTVHEAYASGISLEETENHLEFSKFDPDNEAFHSTLIVDESEMEVCDMEVPSNSDGYILDEATGIFSLSSDAPDNSENSSGQSGNDSEYISTLLIALEKTREKAELLEQENLKKDAKIAELQYFTNGKFVRKIDSLRKENARLVDSVKRITSTTCLSQSQFIRLFRKSNRGLKWDEEDIREGLIHKMKCGTTGYDHFVSKFPILPKSRSLQEAVQFIRFGTGLLHEVFDLIDTMVAGMTDMEKDCQIVLDEMAIQPAPKYDNALKDWVGNCTLSTHQGVASKALLVILAGISVRWKIAVAVELTGKASIETQEMLSRNENPIGEAYKKLLNDVVSRTESAGLKVCGMTTDMGSDNLALWRAVGVTGVRRKKFKTSFPNPARPNSEIYVMPDSVHAMKAVKNMLESNQIVQLPDEIVQAHGLSSGIVDYQHVSELLEFEENFELKVAFRLKKDTVQCKTQFKTMNVGTTKSVLCHRTGVGLKGMGIVQEVKAYDTTAWFITYINAFFDLATCRSRGLAISKHNLTAYNKAIDMIKTVGSMFSKMKVGKKGIYKPVQRGIKVLCHSYLGLINYFLEERGYDFLMLGRFTSDCIENIFSLIRLTQPVPNASCFLQSLKVVTLAQFSEAVKSSSYDYEESSPLSSTNFLEEARRRAKERAESRSERSVEEIVNNPIPEVTEEDRSKLGRWERGVVYDMAGSIIAAIKRSNMKTCPDCIHAVNHKWPVRPIAACFITELKEFSLLSSDSNKPRRQIYVSDEVFQAFVTIEIAFRLFKDRAILFKSADVKNFFVESLMYVWTGSSIPDCHNLCRKILTVFIDYRLKVFARYTREILKKNQALQRSSKSVAMRQVVDSITKTT